MEKTQIRMTRTQRRNLERAKKRAARKRDRRRKAILRWAAISSVTMLFLVIGYSLFFSKPNVSNKGVLRVATYEYYLGVVSVREGIVEAKIPLVNIGEGDLTIGELDTSCGCTTASIVNNEEEGPRFEMSRHGKNPKDWNTVISPGKKAFLKVYYNPAVHPKERGAVTRVVTIHSDDPVKPKQRVKIKVGLID